MPKPENNICSKCGQNPRASEDSTNPWCSQCLAEYMAKYRKQGDWRAERRGIIRGIQAMREHIALHFGQWTGRPFMGAEVVGVVNSLPGPRVADER